jgi:adenosylcobinamide-GDP ribazoletransferase
MKWLLLNLLVLAINRKMMKQELRIFFTALMFYTRIPCPKWVDHDAAYINKATRYFPLIGYIVGGISFLIFSGIYYLLGLPIAIVLSISAGILITGAFHEDGFADVCDGFGGGWTKAKILEIMKDSRVGAYGAIGILLLLTLKYFALHALFSELLLSEYVKKSIANEYIVLIYFGIIFIAYHSLARLTAITIVFTETYAREDEDSKAKPIAQAYSYKEIFGAFILGLIPLVLLAFYTKWQMLFVLLPLIVLRFFMIRYFNKWIQGYTGDCLGAVEQLAEVLTLLGFIIILKF